jgi:hypothetical protein
VNSASNIDRKQHCGIFAVILAAIYILHWPLLRLPYYWDEAGYYVPAARDLFLTGSLIPRSAPSNAHPPLVLAYLAACWKLAGASIFITRSAMILVAAFALLGVFRLAARLANTRVAAASVACTAVYPVFFAQSSLAQVDLAAAGFTFWALDAYVARRPFATAALFAMAVMAKETAVLAPAALLGWVVLCELLPARAKERFGLKPGDLRTNAALLAPIVVLVAWYAYHYAKTGFVFGNPEFFRYNVQATTNPLRIVLAEVMRLWQTFGYMHLIVLTGLMGWAMTKAPQADVGVERPRIVWNQQAILYVVIAAYVIAMGVIGGAVLARYMLPVVPLVIIIAVSTIWRRCARWPALIAVVILAFVLGLFVNPVYTFPLEDNLAYADYIRLHQRAAAYLEQHPPRGPVFTAWPGSDELSQPFLGYIAKPLTVERGENFSAEELNTASAIARRCDTAFLFSTKYEPKRAFLTNWTWWQDAKRRFFGFHQDLSPEAAASLLGGRIVFRDSVTGQWVAVVYMEHEEVARGLSSEQVARVRLHDQPDVAAGSKNERITSRER